MPLILQLHSLNNTDMIPEYAIMVTSIAALLYLAVALQRRTAREAASREDWQDLNDMMTKVYRDNDGLRSDLQRAAKHLDLLQSVNGNLKNTIDDLSVHKQDLLNELSIIKRAMDGLEQQLAYATSPPPEQEAPTSDDLDEWYESQAAPEESKVPPSTDLFNTLRDTFLNPIPPKNDDTKDS